MLKYLIVVIKISDIMKKLIFIIIATMLLAPVALAASSRSTEPLEKITFIHYKDGTVKEVGRAAKSPLCYKLMGVRWGALPVSYAINPTNSQGLSVDFVTTAVSTSAETWDAKTSKELFSNVYTVDYSAAYGVQDFKNAITFGDYGDSNVIAVTTVWYTLRGRQIVEFDILFNARFTWGDATSNPVLMDLQNIATHEIGHSVGLDDIYNSACSAVTMYGYSTNGEIQKRTLEQPDVTGLQKLYGA